MRIIALLPSVALYGKERSNIEVFRIMKKYLNADLLLLVNTFASESLKNALSEFDLSEHRFPSRMTGRFWFVHYIYVYLISNIKFLRILKYYNPDIIYLNSESTIYNFFFIFLFTRVKLIYRIGDVPSTCIRYNKIKSWAWNKIVVGKIFRMVFISNYIRNIVQQTGRIAEQDCVIYNYPPQRKDENIKLLFDKKGDELIVGYLGQIIENKGVELLIKSVTSLRDKGYKIKLLIAGSCEYDELYFLHIKEYVDANYMANDICFLGEISNVADFFYSIDFLCVPSIYEEPLGNVVVEAKYYGKPVVIFPSGGMPELVRHMYDGFVCSNKSVDSLNQAILYYYAHRSEIKLQGVKSRSSLKKLSITYDSFVGNWLAVLS